MMPVRIIYSRGTVVVFAQDQDMRGGNRKNRPVVLVNDFTDEDEFAVGVAITGEFARPLPPTSIPLPFQRKGSRGRCQTGLTKDSVAVCDWLVHTRADGILERIGYLPPEPLEHILDQLDILFPPED